MLTRIIFTFFFFCSVPNFSAQKKLSYARFRADSLKIVKSKLVRPQFRFDNRLAFLNGQQLNITGVDAGVLLKNKLRIAFGYYSVSDNLSSFKKTIDDVEYQGDYHLKYGAINLEFIYLNTRFFSLGMPLEFGFGGNSLNYTSRLADLQTGKQSGFLAISYFGLSGTFKPIRWIGLKAAFGFRKTLYNQVKYLAFDGVYTSVGLSVDVWEIIKDCKMYKLNKQYKKNANSIETAVDLITD